MHHVCEKAKFLKRVAKIAAHYFYSLAFQAHVFTDGNKRTAIASTARFLSKNGLELRARADEQVGFALLTACGLLSFGEVSVWLSKRIKKAGVK